MARAIWNGVVIAESDHTIYLEGNHYFPPSSLKRQYFNLSVTRTTCMWKGDAHYFDIEVDGRINRDAAWFYPDAEVEALPIEDYVAFWQGVRVEVRPDEVRHVPELAAAAKVFEDATALIGKAATRAAG